jgi:8-amino-7-oxononanoate synthase
VLVDGLCPDCGRAAPLRAYLDVVREHGGRLVVDDTQAVGILGWSPGPGAPYGRGGGGSLDFHELHDAPVLVACSLAKAFGAPLAVLAGDAETVGRYERGSATRVHCSPPSVAALRAVELALVLNAAHGDGLRLGLARLVGRFRAGLHALGLAAGGGRYPVQTVRLGAGGEAVHGRLLELGVRAVLRGDRRSAHVTFLITALHDPADLDRALEALDLATRGGARRRARRIT